METRPGETLFGVFACATLSGAWFPPETWLQTVSHDETMI